MSTRSPITGCTTANTSSARISWGRFQPVRLTTVAVAPRAAMPIVQQIQLVIQVLVQWIGIRKIKKRIGSSHSRHYIGHHRVRPVAYVHKLCVCFIGYCGWPNWGRRWCYILHMMRRWHLIQTNLISVFRATEKQFTNKYSKKKLNKYLTKIF